MLIGKELDSTKRNGAVVGETVSIVCATTSKTRTFTCHPNNKIAPTVTNFDCELSSKNVLQFKKCKNKSIKTECFVGTIYPVTTWHWRDETDLDYVITPPVQSKDDKCWNKYASTYRSKDDDCNNTACCNSFGRFHFQLSEKYSADLIPNIFFKRKDERFRIILIRLPILEPEILGNHKIITGTTLLLKTIVN